MAGLLGLGVLGGGGGRLLQLPCGLRVSRLLLNKFLLGRLSIFVSCLTLDGSLTDRSVSSLSVIDKSFVLISPNVHAHVRSRVAIIIGHSIAVSVPLEVNYKRLRGWGLRPVDLALVVLINHGLEDLTKVAGSLFLCLELGKLVILPDLTLVVAKE